MEPFRTTLITFAAVASTVLYMALTRPVEYRTIERTVERAVRHPIDVVTGTYYNPTEGQCDSRPFETADGSMIVNGVRWIAMSRDLLKRWGGRYDYGDSVWIYHPNRQLRGWWVVRDTMNKRWRKRVDFLITDGRKFPGKSNGVLISKSKIV